MNWIRKNWEILGYITLVLASAVFVVCWIAHDRHTSPEVGKTVIATPAPEVKAVPKVGVTIKAPVKVYQGGAILKKKIELPPEVAQDDNQQVIASGKIDAADDHPHTVTTVINTETGESQTYVRTDPLPWLAWDDRGSIGMYAGIKSGAPAVRLQARQGLFSVKAVHFGGIASIDQPMQGLSMPDYFIGIGAEYRW